jgi:hypothetical protein
MCQQTPHPEPSRIRMALLEVIDLDQQGPPSLPGRRMRRPAFVRESPQLFSLKAAAPGGAGRTGDMEGVADTALAPALGIELHDLEPGMRALRVAVIVQERQLLGRRRRALVPEGLDRFVIHALAPLVKDDPGQCTILNPRVESLEPGHCLDHGLRHPSTPAGGDHLEGVRQQPQHALLLDAALQLAHRFRVRGRFRSPRRGAAIGKEAEGTEHCIAPWDLIHKVELELGKVEPGCHAGSLPVYAPRTAEAGAAW